MGLHYDMVPLL